MDLDNNGVYAMQKDEETNSSGSWIWIIVIFIVILFIILAIGLGIWGFRTEENDRTVSATGVVFNVPLDGTIQAVWSSTNNSDDELVLYATSSDKAMEFDEGGIPQGSFINSGTPSPSVVGAIPSTIAASTKVATITDLAAGSYIAMLIVTNPNIRNKSDKFTSPTLPVKDAPIPTIFSIVAAGQTGAITYVPSSVQG